MQTTRPFEELRDMVVPAATGTRKSSNGFEKEEAMRLQGKRLWLQEEPQGLEQRLRKPLPEKEHRWLLQDVMHNEDRRSPTQSVRAEAALYLASDASNFVHGVTLPVDGGYLAI